MERLRTFLRGKTGLCFVVFAAACAVYADSLSGGFVYDDHAVVVENPLVRGSASPLEILLSPYWPKYASGFAGGLYRPLTILSYALNWRLFGAAPVWFHAVNVGLHGLACCLALLLLMRLGRSREAALLGAFAFAVMPIHTEAVSWIVGRGELLAAVFVLAAWLLLYEAVGVLWIAAGLFCYALALLCKESAAAFAAVLIVCEAFGVQGFKELLRRRAAVWFLVFCVLALYLGWRGHVLGSALFVGAPYFSNEPASTVWLTMAKFFAVGWLWPMATGLGLCADYTRPTFPNASMGDLAAWASAASLLAVAVLAGRDWRRGKPWALAVFVFICLAAPLTNLIVPMEILGAERIMYLPSVAFALLIAAGWDSIKGRRMPIGWPKAAAAGCLCAWSVLTVLRNRVWASDEALINATAASAPDNPRMLVGSGILADSAGRHAEARDDYRRALALDPSLGQAAYNMAKSFLDEGDWRDAKPLFEKLETQRPRDPDVLFSLALIAEREGAPQDALRLYQLLLEVDPSHSGARRNAALLLYKGGDTEGAVAQLQFYLKNAPPGEDTSAAQRFLSRIAR